MDSTPPPSDGSSSRDHASHGNTPDGASEGDKERKGTGFWNIVQSVGAAMLGVQSRKNRERDFTHGKPIHFVIGGVVGTLLFLFAIWLLVQYLLVTS